jgi:hypothetical protein
VLHSADRRARIAPCLRTGMQRMYEERISIESARIS